MTTQQNDIPITPNKSKGENWAKRQTDIKTVNASMIANKIV